MYASRIFFLLSVFAFLSLCKPIDMNAQTATRPDFAYPKTVSRQAEKDLSSALEKHDGPATVRALIDYYLAESRIDALRSANAISKIDSVAALASDPVLRSMLIMLEADIYASTYSAARWKYDSRDLPLTPLPENYQEWSGEQFRMKINSLIDTALLPESELKATPIKTYATALSLGKNLSARNETQIYYPSIFDFIANKAIGLLNETGRMSNILSWGLLTRHDLYLKVPFNRFDPTASRILDIYASLLRFHDSVSAPFIITDINRLDFITSHVWSGDNLSSSPTERKSELLRSLYEEYSTSEYSGDILLAVSCNDSEIKKWLAEAIRHNLKAFPAFRRNNNLKNTLSEIEMQGIELSYPTVSAPDSEVTFRLSVSNVKSGKLYIYNVSSSPIAEQSYNCIGLPSLKPLAVIPFSASASAAIPFNEELTIGYRFSSPGQYVAIATIDGAPQKSRNWYHKIHISDYSIAASFFDKTEVWALRASDGAPVEGAKISVIPESSRKTGTPRLIGTTAADGSASFPQNGYAVMSKDGDSFALPLWIYNDNNRRNSPEWRQTSSGYPSLPLYHPGDSVEWMAICYEYKGQEHRPLINKEVTAILRESKYQGIDTAKITSDSYGRVNGQFTLPKEILSGNFCISIDNNNDPVRFMVSDYKLPTFKIILDPVEKDYPAAGDVSLRGRIQTYAGFPLADAKISVTLAAMQPLRWWNRSAPVAFQTLEASSDGSGEFDIVIPKSTLALSPIPGGLFNAEVSAMSNTGESQIATTVFSTGMRYAIRASVPADIDISAPTTAIKVEITDYRDSIVKMPVDFTVIRDNAKVFNGSIMPGKPVIDLTGVKSGSYRLEFSIADSTLAAPVSQDAVLYRPSDKETPTPSKLLWYPSADVKASEISGEGEWLYAVNCPTNLLVTLHTPDSILSQSWVKANAGMNRLKLHLPDRLESATIRIALTGNYRNESASLTLRRDVRAKSIHFVAESFRDRTIPGSEETWTFRVTDRSGQGRQSAVIMDMYNTALDALAKTDWDFTPSTSWGGGYSFRWSQPDLNAKEYQRVYYRPGKLLTENRITAPSFDTYGLPVFNRFAFTSGIRIRGASLYGSRSIKAVDELNIVREHSEEVVEEEAAMDCGAAVTSATNYMAAAKMADNTAYDDERVAESGSGAEQKSAGEAPFTFRDREVPLAFFKPMLETAADGRLSLTFTVPNANTTWGLRAVAFTDSLLSTTFMSEVTASKPVMVQPNLPRFLRVGDKVIIEASVMNGSDERLSVSTTVELFDPADGSTLVSYSRPDSINPGSATTVGIEFIAPSDMPLVGYRIKSASDRFADGEQTLLPILPAVTPVIDSYPFYIAPDQEKFTMTLPVTPDNARITLQYCDNPTWYVVTALPGLLELEASTANEAAASIFSAAIASGLLRDNPDLAAALKEWNSSNKSEGMLTSMLQRNEDLKQILLAATPWMTDAKNDTERMSRLALLFDGKTVRQTIAANIATLRKLQRNGGGWAWYSSGKEASAWATENALLLFGRLLELGFLPDSRELNSMIISALKWMDKETRRDYNKHPDGDYTSYVYMRGFYRNLSGAPAADSKIVGQTVQRILSGWKTSSVFDKAVYAMILNRNSYQSVARNVLASLSEYAESSPEKGMWWPSLDNMTIWSMGKTGTTALILDAYAAIDPSCKEIDLIRQWLILQKEAKDWGTSVTTSSVIASVLSTSRNWITPAGRTKVSVGGKTVEPSDIERLTGSFRAQLSLKAGKPSDLKVSRSGNSPAWGSVFYLYTDSMTSVKAASCQALSVEKNLVLKGNAGENNTSFADTLRVGQRISVTLTLKVDRDMDYVTIIDERPACFEPVEQLPEPIFAEGICFYRENRDSSTRIFIDHLPKGTYVLSYDMWVNNAGQFASGLATVQSQYAPQLSAHSAGSQLTVTPAR